MAKAYAYVRVALATFVKKNRGWLKKIQEELYALSPADKKLFVEALVPGKVEISKGENGGPSWSADFRIVFNSGVFERLTSEGKIKGFLPNGKDSSDSAAAGQPVG